MIVRETSKRQTDAGIRFSDMSSVISELAEKFCVPEVDHSMEQSDEDAKPFKARKLSPQLTKCQNIFLESLQKIELALNSQQQVLTCLQSVSSGTVNQ